MVIRLESRSEVENRENVLIGRVLCQMSEIISQQSVEAKTN